MRFIIVAIFDRALGAYGRPAFVPAVGAAIRSFQDEVNRVDPQNDLNKHPDDFELFGLGSYDDATGCFTTDGPPMSLALGKQMVRGGV